MAVSRQTNSATALEFPPPTPYLVVPSPSALSPVGTSILGQEVLAVVDLVPMVGNVQARAVPVQAPVVDAIGCWLQTWMMTSQKTFRSIPRQLLHPNHLHPLYFRLSNSTCGPQRKRRSRGCTKVPWLVLNRFKVSSRYLPLSRAHHSTRFVNLSDLPSYR